MWGKNGKWDSRRCHSGNSNPGAPGAGGSETPRTLASKCLQRRKVASRAPSRGGWLGRGEGLLGSMGAPGGETLSVISLQLSLHDLPPVLRPTTWPPPPASSWGCLVEATLREAVLRVCSLLLWHTPRSPGRSRRAPAWHWPSLPHCSGQRRPVSQPSPLLLHPPGEKATVALRSPPHLVSPCSGPVSHVSRRG